MQLTVLQATAHGDKGIGTGQGPRTQRVAPAPGLAMWYCERPVKYDANNKDHEAKMKLWGNAPARAGRVFWAVPLAACQSRAQQYV